MRQKTSLILSPVKARINVRLKKLQIATKHALITYRTAYGKERLWLCSAFEKG